MKTTSRVLFIILSIAYPFIIYFGHDYLSPLGLAAILLLMLCLRVRVIGWQHPSAKLWFLAGGIIFLLTAVSEDISALLWYPAAINVFLLAVFSYSLINPPSIIENFARLREPDLPESAVHYTRRVTQIWCGFFIINGLLAGWTAQFSSPKIWALYNGFIAHLLIGVVFLGEWIVRYFYRRKHAN